MNYKKLPNTNYKVKTTFICLFLYSLIITACNSSQPADNSVEGSWRLYDIVSLKETEPDFSTTAKLKKRVKDGSVINFFNDNSFVELDGAGNLVNGKWDFKDENITLTDETRKRMVNMKVEKNQKGKAYNSLNLERGSLLFKYIKIAPPLKKYSDDPFHIANNQWRIKPSKADSTQALYNKMANYFKHLALILKATKERKEEVVSFEFSKGPVRIYNGGIGIYPYDIVPQEWKKGFYNEDEAFTAYSLFEKYLQTNNYKGAAVGDWVEDDYNILLSIYADFNKSDD